MGPLEAIKPWSMRGVEGVYRFLGRVWRLFIDDRAEEMRLAETVQDVPPDRETLRKLHQTIQKVTEDLDGMRFNTAIAAMMEFTNHLTPLAARPRVGAGAVRAAAQSVRAAPGRGTVARAWATRRRWPMSRGRPSTRRWRRRTRSRCRCRSTARCVIKLTVPAGVDEDDAGGTRPWPTPKCSELLAGKQSRR